MMNFGTKLNILFLKKFFLIALNFDSGAKDIVFEVCNYQIESVICSHATARILLQCHEFFKCGGHVAPNPAEMKFMNVQLDCLLAQDQH